MNVWLSLTAWGLIWLATASSGVALAAFAP